MRKIWLPDVHRISNNWISDGYLTIDLGPIIIMIESHRIAMFWDLFMANPEIQVGL
ncbi:MAG: beta-glucosidase, partial [Cyclobacteriaceae bacterium]|nr:beta-glucosidase [Cyclobacteriaceae bacterium]